MLNILVQLFWICLAILESDYEHEFLLGLRLLEKVLDRLPLDRPDVTEKLDKLKVRLLYFFYSIKHTIHFEDQTLCFQIVLTVW